MVMYTLVETNLHSTAIIVELIIKPFGFTKNNAVKSFYYLFENLGSWGSFNYSSRNCVDYIMRLLRLKDVKI